jgi:hypothetical protein
MHSNLGESTPHTKLAKTKINKKLELKKKLEMKKKIIKIAKQHMKKQ